MRCKGEGPLKALRRDPVEAGRSGGGEELAELCAELEDAIILLECVEDAEETAGALEELAGLAEELRSLNQHERADELAATVELARRNIAM